MTLQIENLQNSVNPLHGSLGLELVKRGEAMQMSHEM